MCIFFPRLSCLFFFNDTATTEIYTLSLHDALPIWIIDTAGDGILAEFPSVIAAVECATDIQVTMARRNAEVPENRRMLFRIGINLGDLIHDGARIYGDGINVAARLEGIAEPGGICISRQVFEQVDRALDMVFNALGPRNLKNIARPVDVY